MLKPTDTTSYVNNEVDSPTPDAAPKDTDEMETLQPGVNPVDDSASSEADAGLIDPTRDDAEDVAVYREMDETTPATDATNMEVPMSDLSYREPQLHSPVMGSMNAPGEVDIEELDEETVREALPPDARLDALEE